jgi:multiple sugar transport system substrate-binding protein
MPPCPIDDPSTKRRCSMTTSNLHRRPGRAIAVVLVASLGLAACSSSDQENGSEEGEIRYSWWGSGLRHEKTQEVIDLFQEAHPNITVTGEPSEFANHWEQLTVQSAAGGAP